jgi:hypothetical protein
VPFGSTFLQGPNTGSIAIARFAGVTGHFGRFVSRTPSSYAGILRIRLNISEDHVLSRLCIARSVAARHTNTERELSDQMDFPALHLTHTLATEGITLRSRSWVVTSNSMGSTEDRVIKEAVAIPLDDGAFMLWTYRRHYGPIFELLQAAHPETSEANLRAAIQTAADF